MLRPPAATLRILVVDDQRINQVVARGLLEKQGHEVVVAENGRLALELFHREAFDVVFMDVQMPEMDGLETAAAIRAFEAEEGRPRTPIIALTALVQPEDRQACLDAGMDHYLTKPVQGVDLSEAVQFAAQLLQA